MAGFDNLYVGQVVNPKKLKKKVMFFKKYSDSAGTYVTEEGYEGGNKRLRFMEWKDVINEGLENPRPTNVVRGSKQTCFVRGLKSPAEVFAESDVSRRGIKAIDKFMKTEQKSKKCVVRYGQGLYFENVACKCKPDEEKKYTYVIM